MRLDSSMRRSSVETTKVGVEEAVAYAWCKQARER